MRNDSFKIWMDSICVIASAKNDGIVSVVIINISLEG